MAKKRFTDAEKWTDPWFRKLSPETKLFWAYLVDNCDIAGVWKADVELASLLIGYNYSSDTLLIELNNGKDRIQVFDHGKRWLIIDFCIFQYGILTPNSRVHAAVILLLEKYALLGCVYPIDRVKDKDKDKDILKEGGVGETRPKLEECKAYFLELNAPLEAEGFFDYFSSNGW